MWKQIFSFNAKERLFESIFHVSQGPLCLTDCKGQIYKVNAAFEKMMGYTEYSLIGENLWLLHSENNGKDFLERLFDTLKKKKTYSGDVWHTHRDGSSCLHHINASEVASKDPYYIFSHHDMTDYMALQEKYRYLAYHDPLTGLANRMLFEDRLSHAINNAARTGKLLGVIFCDINEFKAINDDYGHLVGDKILKEISSRILSACRMNDTVSRFGGDEFVIIIENIENENEIDTILQHITDKTSEPLKDLDIIPSLSTGIAVFPNDGMTKEQLIERADQRMYRQKMTYQGIGG